jgi:RNA polymerase sigma factor for flagellar operon FliA
MVGLWQAAKNYQEGRAFRNYAITRIKGAVQDYLRDADLATRGQRQQLTKVYFAEGRLVGKLGRKPTAKEIADETGLTVEQYHQLHAQCYQDTEDAPSLEEGLEAKQLWESLEREIQNLPERERMAIIMHYRQEIGLKDIGIIFGVTESRVCQIIKSGIKQLKARLNG